MESTTSRAELFTQLDNAAKEELSIEKLDHLYAATVGLAQDDVQWYKNTQRKWRKFSVGIRVLTYFTLAIGVVMPLLGDAESSKNGYIYLVISGLLFSADQAFLISQNWMRYIKAEMEIRGLILNFRFSWYEKRCQLVNNPDASLCTVISDFKTFSCEVQQVLTEETESWSTQLNESLTELGSRLKNQTSKMESKMKEIEAENKQIGSGAVELTIKVPKGGLDSIEVSLAGETQSSSDGKSSFTFTDIPAGIQKLEIKAAGKDGKALTHEKAVEVKKASIENIEVQLGK